MSRTLIRSPCQLIADELLDLYRNITKVQQGLFDAMDDSLQQTWDVLNEQKKWSATWKADMGEMQDEIQEAGRATSQNLAKQGNKLSQALEEIQQHAVTSLNKEFAELGEVVKVRHKIKGSCESGKN